MSIELIFAAEQIGAESFCLIYYSQLFLFVCCIIKYIVYSQLSRSSASLTGKSSITMFNEDSDNDFAIEISEMSESEPEPGFYELQPDSDIESEFYVEDLLRRLRGWDDEENLEEIKKVFEDEEFEAEEFNGDNEEISDMMDESDSDSISELQPDLEIDEFERYHQHKIEELYLEEEDWN